jgi:PPOX class probable F420-dependent enzyme
MSEFATFRAKQYLNLETFRKNGQGVRTPVWFAADPADDTTLFVYSLGQSGKAKRLRRNGKVRIAPCNALGTVTGPWIDAQASIVGGEEFCHGMRLIDRKYRPWKQILDLFARFRRHDARIGIAIRHDASSSSG